MTRAKLFKIFYSQDCNCRIGRSSVKHINHDKMLIIDWDGDKQEVYGILTAFNIFCRINEIK